MVRTARTARTISRTDCTDCTDARTARTFLFPYVLIRAVHSLSTKFRVTLSSFSQARATVEMNQHDSQSDSLYGQSIPRGMYCKGFAAESWQTESVRNGYGSQAWSRTCTPDSDARSTTDHGRAAEKTPQSFVTRVFGRLSRTKYDNFVYLLLPCFTKETE